MPAKNPKEYHARRYRENPEAARLRTRKSMAAKRQWYQELLQRHSCEICGETDPVTFDWHHRDPTQKEGAISKMMQSRSRTAILAEMAKCQCLCSNCHRKVHRDLRSET